MTSPLPVEPIERTRSLIKRSAPNPCRPRLSEEDEMALADGDRRAAICYAEIEDVTDRLLRLTEELSSDSVTFDPDDDDTPDPETDR